jgi:hypothetical protein
MFLSFVEKEMQAFHWSLHTSCTLTSHKLSSVRFSTLKQKAPYVQINFHFAHKLVPNFIRSLNLLSYPVPN